MGTQSPSLGDLATHSPRIGQACDRCRWKKIKCDGDFPSCRVCAKAGVVCEISATLRRRTKVRGFASDDQRLEQLQAELTKCQQKLKVEQDQTATLRQELYRREQIRLPHEPEAIMGSAEYFLSGQTKQHPVDDSNYIIKHMGRLVHDEKGVGRFAGSTTGVHFVLTVEQECQKVLNLSGLFSESCFRLFLAQPSPTLLYDITETPPGVLGEIKQCLVHSSAYYQEQASQFIQKWEAFCPFLVREQLVADIRDLFDRIHAPSRTDVIDYATVLTVLMILKINEYAAGPNLLHDESGVSAKQMSLANHLVDKIAARGNFHNLQALSLFAFCNQLSGHCLAATTLNGTLVSVAQSLGLHRHARRFKMGLGEIELRKRLWWWIYVFDRITSVLHGLPPLINDVDVDNDLPLDCHLHDLEATELSHPLPGETTAVFAFLQYVSIGKKLSRILNLLYTTTQRRDGARKITDLDRDLRVWNQNLKASGIFFDIGNPTIQHAAGDCSDPSTSTATWLELMANVTMILINRPGLTFHDSTPEFGSCLRSCLDSSSAILSLLEGSHIPGWLRNMSLIGPGTVFQSALMQIYCQLKRRKLKPNGYPGLDTSMSMVSKGIYILTTDNQNCSTNQSNGTFYSESLKEVIQTLQSLLSSISLTEPVPEGPSNVVNDNIPPSDLPERFGDQNWGGNALDALNYMTPCDWMIDATGPFMGFMEFSESQHGDAPTIT